MLELGLNLPINAVTRHTRLLVDEIWTGAPCYEETLPWLVDQASQHLSAARLAPVSPRWDRNLNSWNKGSCWQVQSVQSVQYCFTVVAGDHQLSFGQCISSGCGLVIPFPGGKSPEVHTLHIIFESMLAWQGNSPLLHLGSLKLVQVYDLLQLASSPVKWLRHSHHLCQEKHENQRPFWERCWFQASGGLAIKLSDSPVYPT